MTDRVKFIEHQGRRILHIDWTNGSAEEILAAMAEAQKIIASQPPASVLTLTSVHEAKVTRAVTEELKAYVAHNKPYVLAGAVVGLNDLKMIIFNFVNRVTGRALRAMDDVASAKDWLAATRQI
ncbi:MAG TPA: hypothetical protein VM733_14325 [Thermoanaerobaculia bacterium]|nr:hypothetical protein [Thermoanaerobaculia bacterium]